MQTVSHATNTVPAVAAVVTHAVEDFTAWKHAFDEHATTRRAAGIVAAHVNRHTSDPNKVSVYLAATDRAKLDAFLSNGELMATMRKAGVKGPPHIAIVAPVEDLTVKDRALAGAIVRHEVSDYAAWRTAFDAHAGARAQAGIIGHAVNRLVENPNVIVVYLQAESLDSLTSFTSSADVKNVMKNAGVVGAPDVMFVTGGVFES